MPRFILPFKDSNPKDVAFLFERECLEVKILQFDSHLYSMTLDKLLNLSEFQFTQFGKFGIFHDNGFF